MALNIDWRFAGPQDINVPQSNFLNSLDKNIQKGLEIKKEFDKKRYDNEMIRLMTEDAEKKLADAIKTNDIEKIKVAEKELADAKMSANQFKTTGTTDFFRWKKDKEYASDVAAINREMLNEQNKQEQLSNLEYDIKSKQAEFDRSNNKDEKRRLTDEINHLKERANKIAGEKVYDIINNTPTAGKTPAVNTTPTVDVPQNTDDIKSVDYLNNEISKLTWQENLANTDAVKQIQDEIDKYSASNEKDKLQQALNSKIVELNKAKAAADEAKRKAKEAKAEAARKAKEGAAKDLETWYKEKDPKKLLTYYNDAKNDDKELKGIAKKYLIDFLSQTNTPGLNVLNNTTARAAKQKYKDDLAMKDFIDANAAEINAAQQKK